MTRKKPDIEVLKRKAEDGDAEAQKELGHIYRDICNEWPGLADYDESTKWFSKAAGQKDVDALYELHFNFEYYHEDEEKASILLEQAAEAGSTQAQDEIARRYEEKGNDWAAIRWNISLYENPRADNRQKENSAYKIAMFFETKAHNHVKQSNYKITQVSKHYFNQSYDWYQKAADLGHEYSQFKIAMFHLEGKGRIIRNFTRAFKMLMKTACKSQEDSMDQLSKCYRRGIGTQKSNSESYVWAILSGISADEVIELESILGLKLIHAAQDEASARQAILEDPSLDHKQKHKMLKEREFILDNTEPVSDDIISTSNNKETQNERSEETGDPEPSSGLAYKYVGNIRKNFDPSLVEFELVVPRKLRKTEDMDFTHIRIRYDRRDTDIKAIDQFKKHKINAKQRRILICLAAQNSAGDEEKSAINTRKILREDSSGPDISRLNGLFNLIFPDCLPSSSIKMLNRQSGLVNIRLRIDMNKIINARDYGSCRL